MSEPRRWTILRSMAGIACLAPVLALARHPFAFGFLAASGGIALGLWACWRNRWYAGIAGLLCLYPALPLANLHLMDYLLRLRVIRRSSPGFLDGVLATSDVGALACVIGYVGCVAVAFRRTDPALRRMAMVVAIALPALWMLFFLFAVRDPFGALGRVVRF